MPPSTKIVRQPKNRSSQVKKKLSVAAAKRNTLDNVVSDFIREIKANGEFRDELKYIGEKEKLLQEFITEGKSGVLNPANQLIVLRKWNSYTPVLPPTKKEYLSKGGGYFIRLGLTGIVIDPGFNFIENFFRCGFKIDDIDHVFISHAHNDHTVELEGLLSLLFKRNKRCKSPKKIKLYMNLGSFKKFAGYFDLSNPEESFYLEDIVILNAHQLVAIDEDVDLFTTRTQHHEMITRDYALGFTFRFRFENTAPRVVKFTSDTGWNEDIEQANKDASSHFRMDSPDILLAHIGSVKKKELKYRVTHSIKENSECLYKYHLGLLGTALMQHFWKPTLLLISEFGEEMNAVRERIAEVIGKHFKQNVFATDLNFRVDIETLQVYCFNSKKFHPANKIGTFPDDGSGQLYFLENKLTEVQRREKRWTNIDVWNFRMP